IPRTKDPSDRSRHRRRATHDRIQSIRHRRDLVERRALACNMGRRRKRSAAHRRRHRRGERESRDAGRHGNFRARIGWTRPLLLRQRYGRQGARSAYQVATTPFSLASTQEKNRGAHRNPCHGSMCFDASKKLEKVARQCTCRVRKRASSSARKHIHAEVGVWPWGSTEVSDTSTSRICISFVPCCGIEERMTTSSREVRTFGLRIVVREPNAPWTRTTMCRSSMQG